MRTARLCAVLLAWLAFVGAAMPCAPAPQRGDFVEIAAERALIIYDSETKTEHFIRQANFRSQAADFGFLVPSPTRPELGEVSSGIFSELTLWTAARHEWSGKTVEKRVQKRKRVQHAAGPRASKVEPGPSAEPQVIEKKTVGGYDAVVLKGGDLDGLKAWLAKNAYETRAPLMEWLAWYVEHEWYITAFKVANDPSQRMAGWNLSVRMSFVTERPFYPYREPQETPAPANATARPRELRVFFLADGRYQSTLGDNENWSAGVVKYSMPLQAGNCQEVFATLRLGEDETRRQAGKKWRLTEFEDRSSPRRGTDEVYFHVATDQTEFERPVVYFDKTEIVYFGEPEPTPSQPQAADVNLPAFFAIGIAVAIIVVAVVAIVRALRPLRSAPKTKLS